MTSILGSDQVIALLESMEGVFWDFDGVILDSMGVREAGFAHVLRDYPEPLVEQLLEYHRNNGGLSRYVKFNYFQSDLLGEEVDDGQTATWAAQFSEYNESRLKDRSLLIEETGRVIKELNGKVPQFIVSGSDGKELRRLNKALGLRDYFERIEGSPTPKTELVQTILRETGFVASNCILIGDSGNDYDAASRNGLQFCGFNGPDLKGRGEYYWE